MQAQHVQPSRPAREGSPWTGLWAVVAKEIADNLTSVRLLILEVIVVLIAFGTVYSTAQDIRADASQGEFAFLQLFTTGHAPVPSFIEFLGLLVPLIAIALSFDSVNREFNQRTMSRLLAQPIYRDALLLGKFLAGLFTLMLVLLSSWLLVVGISMLRLGLVPSGEEIVRSLIFLLATLFYGGVWLALAMLCSIKFRQTATAALVALAAWLFLIFFWAMIANMLVNTLRPLPSSPTFEEEVAHFELQLALPRFSPRTLFLEAASGLMEPYRPTLGLILPIHIQQFVEGGSLARPRPLSQSLGMVWPQLTGLIAATILLFGLGYVLFQRQEIRA